MNAPLDEADLSLKLFGVARDSARWMLDNAGQVPPHVIAVAGDGTVSEPYFPHDALEEAGWGKLLEAAAGRAREQMAAGDAIAVAVSVELVNEGQRGVGIQVETASRQICRILPVQTTAAEHQFAEPLIPDRLLFDRLAPTPPGADDRR